MDPLTEETASGSPPEIDLTAGARSRFDSSGFGRGTLNGIFDTSRLDSMELSALSDVCNKCELLDTRQSSGKRIWSINSTYLTMVPVWPDRSERAYFKSKEAQS